MRLLSYFCFHSESFISVNVLTRAFYPLFICFLKFLIKANLSRTFLKFFSCVTTILHLLSKVIFLNKISINMLCTIIFLIKKNNLIHIYEILCLLPFFVLFVIGEHFDNYNTERFNHLEKWNSVPRKSPKWWKISINDYSRLMVCCFFRCWEVMSSFFKLTAPREKGYL